VTHTIEHRQVEANGITFHVAASGPATAPPVLCLHGFPEGWMSWRAVMEQVDDCRVVAPTLRGYPGTDAPKGRPDVMTLTDDVKALIEVMGLDRPLLVTHDWGGGLGWIFAHRYSDLISGLVVINCTHTKTLVRAALTFDHLQPLRIPWVLPFQIPWVPEFLLTTRLGRRFLRWSFTVREGRPGTMDRRLVDEIVGRFRHAADLRGPIDYYRAFVARLLVPGRRRELYRIYETPVTVPVTMLWGMQDGALPAPVAKKSGRDAGCDVEWRPLPHVGHFVDLEAPDQIASEIRRALGTA
jgi:pimeloyl-ACP methyl ester carboxylesterase